jgi:hypothetical protein
LLQIAVFEGCGVMAVVTGIIYNDRRTTANRELRFPALDLLCVIRCSFPDSKALILESMHLSEVTLVVGLSSR